MNTNNQYPPSQPQTLTLKPTLASIQADISQMPETPIQRLHRRAHSDTTFFRYDNLDEDLLLFDPNDFNISDLTQNQQHQPSLSAEEPMTNRGGLPRQTSMDSDGGGGGGGHFRSLSVDADFFEGLGFSSGAGSGGGGGGGMGEEGGMEMGESEGGGGGGGIGIKKAMPKDKLAELSLIDPKRARRILANRQSAARSKERKIRYTGDLERKLHTLQTEATTLSAQVTILQRDEANLRALNNELKLRLQAAEQEAHLRDALNEALKEEVRRLKIESGECPVPNNAMHRGPPRPYFSQSQQPAHHYNIPQGHQQQRNVMQQETMDFHKMVLK